MDQGLIDIAEAGNIDALYALLHQNPYVLEKVDHVPFVSTPLHVAVSAGQTRFTKEIISLKPFFARKLNQDGNSPIHLASTKGHLEIVRELLKIGDDLCLLKGREKRIPLHSAAIAGRILVLGELLKACPESLGELTVRGETALHLSVKNNQFEAFKLLLEWHKNLHEWEVDASALQLVQKSIKPESLKVLMERLKQINKEEFKRTIYSLVLKNHEWEAFRVLRGKIKQIKKEDVVNWKDDEGNTVLHLAVSIKQRQMIQELLFSDSARGMVVDMNVNAMNLNNQTALDVLLQLPDEEEKREIEDILRGAGVVSVNDMIISTSPSSTSHTHVLPNLPIWTIPRRAPWSISRSWATYLELWEDKDSPNYVRNAMLVVAVLIATETFQTGLNPPGGYWQDDYYPNLNNTNITTASQYSHTAGTPIASTQWPFRFTLLAMFNFVGFLLSMIMILLLTCGFPLRRLLLTAQFLMISTFSSSLWITTPSVQPILSILSLILVGVITYNLVAKNIGEILNRHTGSEDGDGTGP